MGYQSTVRRLASTRFGSWLARQTAARADPYIYRASRGRWTLVGRQLFPQLLLTTVGRRSGKPRTVQVAFVRDGDDYVVVASNFGQQHSPAWMYNLLADPQATVQVEAQLIKVRAERAEGTHRDRLLAKVIDAVSPIGSYLDRTDREIQVFRLHPE